MQKDELTPTAFPEPKKALEVEVLDFKPVFAINWEDALGQAFRVECEVYKITRTSHLTHCSIMFMGSVTETPEEEIKKAEEANLPIPEHRQIIAEAFGVTQYSMEKL